MKSKNFPKECSEFTKDISFVLEDEGVSIRLLNPAEHKIEKIKIDHCAIKDGDRGNRCDYLLVCKGYSSSHFFEFKHKTNIGHGHEQLKETMRHDVVARLVAGLKKKCWIVTSKRYPKTPDLQKVKETYKKDFAASFDYAEPDPSPPLSLA